MLEPDEVDAIVDDGEDFFNEYYAEEYGIFDREYFSETWKMLLFTGQGIIFVESDAGQDRGAFGCIRGSNLFVPGVEYIGIFTAVKRECRGGTVVISLMEGVHRLLEKLGLPCHIFLSTRLDKLQAAWTKVGYESHSRRYMRRITP